MTKHNFSLESRLREIAELKAQSGQYEIVDDMVTADILDKKSEAMLNQLNDDLAARIAPEDFENLPVKAKLLLQQLGQLYCKLYAEVNLGASPTYFTALMNRLKTVVPILGASSIAVAATVKAATQSNRNIIYVILGWILGGILGTAGVLAVQGPSKDLPASAAETLGKIREVEKQLGRYGINFTPVLAGVPQINRERYYA